MTEFICDEVWPHLKRSARAARRGDVAVAYFGVGASEQLPLQRGSTLVVDASEATVRAGQTCPAELLLLVQRGVQVYSIANLHAKVYVFGRSAFIGSANVSARSANTLVETMLRTSERQIVTKARAFVRGLCRQPLTPELLRKLQSIYRPPRFVPGGGVAPTKRRRGEAQMPRVHVVQLERVTWSDRDEREHDAGAVVARRKRAHGRTWHLDSFLLTSAHRFRVGDMAMMITEEANGNALVDVPGNIVHIRPFRVGSRMRHFVFIEIPGGRRRRALPAVARQLGRGWRRRLQRSGLIRNRDHVDTLLEYWER